ncbi:NAD(P)/FAD-dependent oxidoreductase [Chryseolinea sp. T2]|uniref:phytoene desaturase family protein n=1 Tax=Chryseolinea sp. T2 TaxID=3129255 RepID=UPI003078536D
MEYDAVVVGSGPNGLCAAITMQRQGLSVLLIEGRDTVGGGLRSGELTIPGLIHDRCSAIHPMAVASPLMSELPLQKFGVDFMFPDICAAHPLDNGNAVVLRRSLGDTARALGTDAGVYNDLIGSVVESWPLISQDLLGPLAVPAHPIAYAKFGLKAIRSSKALANKFKTAEARALWAGMCAHSMVPLSYASTAAIGFVLTAVGHVHGWPIVRGGSQRIADALEAYFISLGGTIKTGMFIKSLSELPPSKAVLLDVSTNQLLQIAGHKLSSIYKWQLKRYQYKMGVFKVDFAVEGKIPFRAELCREAGTVHLGNTFEEIAHSEDAAWSNRHSEKPFVLLTQQSVQDPSRSDGRHHTVWAYCHVPNGSDKDMTTAIEQQIERYAPGFRDRIVAKHITSASAFEQYNPNYVGGDINGGAIDVSQLFTRPALRFSPYKTSAKGIYICSASTPPGGGVHGMCGYHAAKRAMKDLGY